MKNLQYQAIIKEPRAGNKDMWNAHMAKGAKFCAHDIPFCPTTAKGVPKSIITWEEAKAIYKERTAKKDYNFKVDAFVCFYIDDCKFDGPRGIWHDYKQALKVLRHFAGVITPDFSTYQDFPKPIKLYATYRMRLYGYWLGVNGLQVINNVRWGTPETWYYCFEGIPEYSLVAIGTVGGSPRKIVDRIGAKVTDTTPNSKLNGVEKITYKMPKKDKYGNPTGDYKAGNFKKTVYDPSQINTDTYIKWGLQAANNAANATSSGKLGHEWSGTDNQGVKWHGYCDSDGNITSFYPED